MIWRCTWSDICHCVALNLLCAIFALLCTLTSVSICTRSKLHNDCIKPESGVLLAVYGCHGCCCWCSCKGWLCPMRHTFISVSMSRKKIADTRERNYQFRYSENCYTECCGLSRFGTFVHTSLKEATVHWQKPQHDTEQYFWYWKWLVMTLMVSSGFSNMVLQSTQPVDQWLTLEQCFQDTSSDTVLRQFISVMFWIIRNIICPLHSNKRPPKTDLYKLYPPRNACTASILKHSLILLFYVFIDPGFFKKINYGIL